MSTFNFNDWLPENKEANPVKPVQAIKTDDSTVETDLERITASIEASQLDLTTPYQNWLTIGFALVDELGERGRRYFHRLSRFNPGYSEAGCDKQYDSCLHSHSQGTTIKSLFFLAQQAGVKLAKERPVSVMEKKTETEGDPEDSLMENPKEFKTPQLPAKVYDNLPRILAESSRLFTDGTEKDIFLLSVLTVLSACLPQIHGSYFNCWLSPHLYLFITGPSASGKGTMIWSRYFAQNIHEERVKEAAMLKEAYLQELEAYENLPKIQKIGLQKPLEPPRKLFFIPGNCSSAALTQILADNNFRGLIFETEADTMTNTAKQDWGDSSDIFRKAFHHENTSMARRQNNELFEVKNPHLAICLSGTPKQVHHLMPEVENGLFSRFMYYSFQDTRGFLNPFVSYQSIDYHYFFTQKGYEISHLHDRLEKMTVPIKFQLTDEQGARFTDFFSNLLEKNKMLLSQDLDANTKRLGVITFRIAMVLSALRLMDLDPGAKISHQIICSDIDFQTAMTIATTLESHAVSVYQQMPKITLKGLRLTFFEKLPDEFDRKAFLAVAKEIGISPRTADKYIQLFCEKLLDHDYNNYKKKK